MSEVWPILLSPSRVQWRPSSASKSGGRTVTNFQQTVRSDIGFWIARWEGPVHGEDRNLALRAMMAQLEGMSGEIEVPCITNWRPYNQDGRMLSAAGAQTIGGRSVFNHNGWWLSEPELMTVVEDTVRGRMRLRILHPDVPPLRAGHYFGIGNRLYLVSRTWQEDQSYANVVGGEVTYGGEILQYGGVQITYGELLIVIVGENREVIEFWPRLREAVAAGTPLILGRPTCLMSLVSDEQIVNEDGIDSVVYPALEFEEVFR